MHLSYTLVMILSLSILIAGVLSIFRFNQIRDIYRPFIYLTWASCLAELTSIYLAFNHYYSIIPFTIHSLFESLLLLWFFQKVGVLKKSGWLYFFIVLFVIIWFIESFLTQHFGSHFTFY